MKLVSSLACLRVEADPPRGLDGRARVAVEKLWAKNGLVRDGLPNHPGAEVDLELTAALAKCLEDPDAKPLPPPSPPQKYRTYWAAHVGTDVVVAEWAANHSSAWHIEDKVNESFEEQERQGRSEGGLRRPHDVRSPRCRGARRRREGDLRWHAPSGCQSWRTSSRPKRDATARGFGRHLGHGGGLHHLVPDCADPGLCGRSSWLAQGGAVRRRLDHVCSQLRRLSPLAHDHPLDQGFVDPAEVVQCPRRRVDGVGQRCCKDFEARNLPLASTGEDRGCVFLRGCWQVGLSRWHLEVRPPVPLVHCRGRPALGWSSSSLGSPWICCFPRFPGHTSVATVQGYLGCGALHFVLPCRLQRAWPRCSGIGVLDGFRSQPL